MQYYLGIDQGTTGTTSILFDEHWNICGKAKKEHQQLYPQPGWVEHDPMELWANTKEVVAKAINQAGVQARELKAIGLANQGETCLVWNKRTGLPIYNAIVWQDRRTASAADELNAGYGPLIWEKTGLLVDAYYSALKIKWILDHVSGAWQEFQQGQLMAGTLDTWLLWKMTAGKVYATDSSTASRTMLYNLHQDQWDDEILKIIGLPQVSLPHIQESAGFFGYTSREFIDAECPITASLVDQAAALFGQTCFETGAVKTTYGTGSFSLMNIGPKVLFSDAGLITSTAWRIDQESTFALEGGVYIGGAAIQWLRDGLKIIGSAAETEAMALSVTDTGGVSFVPAFSGLAAPYWDQYARGMMIGITGGTTREHIVRATLEAIAFQVAENLAVLESDSGIKIQSMRADGGATTNRFLMQFQADILGIPIEVPEINETTVLGAAYMAALGVGDFNSLDSIKSNWRLKERYTPSMGSDQRNLLMKQWKQAVKRSTSWSDPID